MTRRDTLTIPCVHAECPNTLTLGADERQPKDWLCPNCEARADEQLRLIWLDEYMKRTAVNAYTALNPNPQRMH